MSKRELRSSIRVFAILTSIAGASAAKRLSTNVNQLEGYSLMLLVSASSIAKALVAPPRLSSFSLPSLLPLSSSPSTSATYYK